MKPFTASLACFLIVLGQLCLKGEIEINLSVDFSLELSAVLTIAGAVFSQIESNQRLDLQTFRPHLFSEGRPFSWISSGSELCIMRSLIDSCLDLWRPVGRLEGIGANWAKCHSQ